MDTHGSTSGDAGAYGDGPGSGPPVPPNGPGAEAGSSPPPYQRQGQHQDQRQDQHQHQGAGHRQDAAGPAVGLGISQRMYLPAGAGAQDLHAILTVHVDGIDEAAATGAAAGADGPPLAEVLVVDCSVSMNVPEKKIHAARQAAVTALKALPDGTPFAIVKGTHHAVTVYPPSGPMRPASAATRAEAALAVYAMQAGGGTCVGNWLDLAGTLLAEQSAPIPHVLMLTDGRNEHDDRNPLAAVLDTWQGRFLCDAWGIGKDWDAQVLVDVTTRLHGSADAVHDESELPSAYAALVERLLAKPLPELEIRVTPSPGSRLRYLRQMFPNELILPQTATETATGAAVAFTTRAWGNEVRRYQLCLTVDPEGRALDEDLQAAVVEVVAPGSRFRPAGGHPPGPGELRLPPAKPCRVRWTDDPVPALTGNEEDEHFEKHRRLGDTAGRAAEAFRVGQREAAVRLLGIAVMLAHELNAHRQLAELQRIVEIRDPANGNVVLREGVTRDAFEHLITASTHTTHGPTSDGLPGGDLQVRPVAGLVGCPKCRAPIPSNAKFCPHCRHRLTPRVEAP
ncbi:VWA domain-containing protein [Streptomyces sp. NBC_00669]|uniref:VWA domain-containing protein n=1 Tax=Streptomyces sp. NBC_00669 TaxID=2976011 RepID=UPI002E3510D1|nr:VWA domain-containing protein [Streptomyces sp. NBC_00669]